jgi:hypothetical protein
MARARRVLPRTSSPSITQSVLRLASVTGQTALQNAQEVGAQLMMLAQQTMRGTQSASVAIAGDVAAVARRAAAGMADGLHELRADVTRPRGVSRRPPAKITARRRTPAGRGGGRRSATRAT